MGKPSACHGAGKNCCGRKSILSRVVKKRVRVKKMRFQSPVFRDVYQQFEGIDCKEGNPVFKKVFNSPCTGLCKSGL